MSLFRVEVYLCADRDEPFAAYTAEAADADAARGPFLWVLPLGHFVVSAPLPAPVRPESAAADLRSRLAGGGAP